MQVHTVLVPLQHPGTVTNAVYRGDVIFLEEQPMLVLEWTGERGASDPHVTVKLSRTCLKEAPAEKGADFLHEDPVIDPRPKILGRAHASVLEEARRTGLLDGGKSEHVSFRAPLALVEAAKRETGVGSVSELGVLALAVLAQRDPVAAFFHRTEGRLGPDHDLEY